MEELAKEAEAVAGEAYKDALQPSVAPIGKTVGRAVELALAPINGALWLGEEMASRLGNAVKERIQAKAVDPNQVIMPDPLVAGQIMEAYKFAQHTELKDLYIELLSTSMVSDTAPRAHPSFVQMLRSMTPDDARILKYITDNESAPALEIRAVEGEGVQYLVIYRHASLLAEKAKCSYSETVDASIDNLAHMGLIEVEHGSLSDDRLYNEIENHKFYKEVCKPTYLRKIRSSIESVHLKRLIISITDLGRQFEKAVIPSTYNE